MSEGEDLVIKEDVLWHFFVAYFSSSDITDYTNILHLYPRLASLVRISDGGKSFT